MLVLRSLPGGADLVGLGWIPGIYFKRDTNDYQPKSLADDGPQTQFINHSILLSSFWISSFFDSFDFVTTVSDRVDSDWVLSLPSADGAN